MAREPDQTRRNPQSTAAILRAALELATEDGWSKVSMDRIAARAGVGKRTIYRWWPSKGAVVLDAFAHRLQDSPLMDPGTIEDNDIRDDLVRLVKDAWIDTVGDSESLVAALIGEAQHDRYLAEQIWERVIVPSSEHVMGRLRRGQDEGEIAAGVDPYRAAELLYGQIYLRLLLTPNAIDESFLEDCVDLALGGLKHAD